MMKSDLHPPQTGPSADPILYGVAAGLAELFPPVLTHTAQPDQLVSADRDDPSESRDRD